VGRRIDGAVIADADGTPLVEHLLLTSARESWRA
jgi:hypothetical protein